MCKKNTYTYKNKGGLSYLFGTLIIFLVFISTTQAQNAVTPQGQETNSGSNFIDKNGRIVAYTALTKQGEELFKCCDPFTDPRDGNTYNIIRIGNQCWMAENLKYLPAVSPSTTVGGTPYYYVYDYNGTNVSEAKATSNYNTYGVLYNWFATIGAWVGSSTNPSGIQGPCPSGWHVPSQSEWTQMTDYLSLYPQYWCDGNSTFLAKTISSTSGWTNDVSTCAVGNNPSLNNNTGFNGLPSGLLSGTGTFAGLNQQAYWWTATSIGSPWSYYTGVSYNNDDIIISIQRRDLQALSVRCVRNDCPYLTVPVGASHIPSATQIQWNWGAVSDATGYKYNTSDDYATATDIGLTTTFTQNVSHGTCGQFTLYIWAYNNCGVSNTGVLIEENLYTDVRDGNQYTTVQVGNQCWMKENLNYAAGGSWCYDDNATNCDTYGRLYNWATLMNGSASSSSNPSGVQGQCPSGWHIPSDAEWSEMTDYLEGNSTFWCGGVSTQIGRSLANNSGWLTGGATGCDVAASQFFNNSTNFTAIPSGIRQSLTVSPFYSYGVINSFCEWYTATESTTSPTTHAWARALNSTYEGVYRWGENKQHGYSARCVRD